MHREISGNSATRKTLPLITDFTPADQLFFDQVQAAATENEKIRQAATANTLSNFEPVFNQHLETLLLDRMNGNEAIFNRIMNDEAFKSFIAQKLMHNVFEKINRWTEQ